MCDHFARELIKVVVVQICQEAGFQSIQSSALDALTDIMIKYLEELGYGTHLYAEASCRTDSNFLDLSLALADCNGSIKELLEYANQVDEIPFAKPIPPFPIRAAEVKTITVEEIDEERPDYVPSYLPPFPGKHTYIFTPTFEETTAEPGKIRKLKNKRKRQVEASLAQLDSHVHTNKIPKKAEAPDYFSASKSNTFINSLGLRGPTQIKAKLKVKHRKFMDEVNPSNEGERPQTTLTQQDDGAEAKRKEKYEKILSNKQTNEVSITNDN